MKKIKRKLVGEACLEVAKWSPQRYAEMAHYLGMTQSQAELRATGRKLLRHGK